MKAYVLSEEQKSASGFTNLFVITYKDFAATTTATTDLPITLTALNFGDVVEYNPLMEIKTAFAGLPDAIAVSLGVTSALTQFIGASNLVTTGPVAIAAKTAYTIAAAAAPYVTPTGGKNLIANFDVTDATNALSTATAGELWIWVKISRWAARDSIQA
jgi:hypothetical protein